jgi:hypothetical protein
MNLIYGGAWATIVALEGDSASAGLSLIHHPQRRSRQVICKIGDLHLATVLPTLQQQINKSKWATRAWTYQEAFLSPRNIYFTADQVYFSCNILQCCEAINETTSPIHLMGYEERFSQLVGCICHAGPDKVLGKGIFRNPVADLPAAGQVDPEAKFKWRLIKYDDLLLNYSVRDMTYSSDALAAIQGILNQLDTSWFVGYSKDDAYTLSRKGSFWGLPLCSLPFALLFVHSDEHERRPDFPSWSWTGWKGKLWTASRGQESGSETLSSQPPLRAWHWHDGGLQYLFRREFPFQDLPRTLPYKEKRGRPWQPDMLFIEGYIWHLDLEIKSTKPKNDWPFTFVATLKGFDVAVCEVCCYNEATMSHLKRNAGLSSCLLLANYLHGGEYTENHFKTYDLIVLDWVEAATGTQPVSPRSRAGMVAERLGAVRLLVRRHSCHWMQMGSFKPYWAYVPIVLK